VTFTAAASGAAATQWQASLDGGNTWSDVVGAIAGTLSVTTKRPFTMTLYRAVFSNSGGKTVSRAARLFVF
jgi:hypothetical protein